MAKTRKKNIFSIWLKTLKKIFNIAENQKKLLKYG